MKIKRTPGSIILEIVMLMISAIFVYPFYYLIINTIKTSQDAAFHPLGLPQKIVFSNYAYVLENSPVLNAFKNSLVITIISVALILLFGSMAAFAIVFRQNRLNRFLFLYLLAGFMIPMQSTLIPLFEIMHNLHFIDKIYGIIIFYTQGCVFAFFIYQGFMRTFPKDILEAAIIDGSGPFIMFSRIVFPLMKPISVTLVIYHTMWIWNDFLFASQFLNSRRNDTLVLEIFQARGQYSTDWAQFMSMLVIVLIPVTIFYLLLQKQIIKGLMGGAVKG